MALQDPSGRSHFLLLMKCPPLVKARASKSSSEGTDPPFRSCCCFWRSHQLSVSSSSFRTLLIPGSVAVALSCSASFFVSFAVRVIRSCVQFSTDSLEYSLCQTLRSDLNIFMNGDSSGSNKALLVMRRQRRLRKNLCSLETKGRRLSSSSWRRINERVRSIFNSSASMKLVLGHNTLYGTPEHRLRT
jgi:hypothetical protein